MRRLGLAAIALAVGCFDELPAPPGGTEGSGGTTAGSTTTGTTAVPTTAATDDADPMAMTTGGAAPQGLFACVNPPVCAVWDCSQGCAVSDETATCVLAALRERADQPLTVIRCDGECREHRVVPRGGGAEEAKTQSRTMGEPAVHSSVQRCALKPSEFFAGCLKNYEASCSDPATWVEGCAAEPAPCE